MEENKDKDIELEGQKEVEESGVRVQSGDGFRVIPLKGLIDNWFIDYASSVILDRAVPEINDGSCFRRSHSVLFQCFYKLRNYPYSHH